MFGISSINSMSNKFMTLGNEFLFLLTTSHSLENLTDVLVAFAQGIASTKTAHISVSTSRETTQPTQTCRHQLHLFSSFLYVLTCFYRISICLLKCIFKFFGTNKKTVFKTPVFPHVSKCTSRMDPMGVKNGIKKQKEPDLVPESVTSSAISVEIVASPFS